MTLEDRNGRECHHLSPVSPARQLHQIIGPHHPDKAVSGPSREALQQFHRESRAKAALERHDLEPRVSRDGGGTRQPLLQARHAIAALQRVLRAHQPPDLVQSQTLQGLDADMAVALMGRIERAAQQPDAQDRCRSRRRRVERDKERQRPPPDPLVHWPAQTGRTWPSPRTTYLNVVNCSTPTGPRACRRPVAIPISAPMPNSPPSAN